jgi:hypothetical protein
MPDEGYTVEGKALMLWNEASAISHVSLHSGPATAENELKGGVYRRKQIDFKDPIDGSIRTQREIEFEVPQGAHVTHAGFWTSSIGGTMLARGRTKPHTFRGRGVYVIDLVKMDLNSEG